MKALKALGRFVAHVEDAILVVLLTAMIFLAVGQVVLRQLDQGLIWLDPTLKMMVLWLGLTGAVVASRTGRHITIDLLGRWIRGRPLALIETITALFTATVAGLIAWHGARLVGMDMEGGGSGVGNIPAWVVEAIIPVAFALLALSHLADAGTSVVALVRGRQSGTGTGPREQP